MVLEWLSSLQRASVLAALSVLAACSVRAPSLMPPAMNVSAASSGTHVYKVLYRFRGPEHGDADGVLGLISDGTGGFFGTSFTGGTGKCVNRRKQQGCGTVFRLTRSAAGTWKEAVVFSFEGGADGWNPMARLALGRNGVLYGTTVTGGHFHGTVFALLPPSSPNGRYTERVLYSFKGGTDGAVPTRGVTIASDGSLYGVTSSGGATGTGQCSTIGCGIIFRLVPSGTQYVEIVVHRFTGGADGMLPSGGLVEFRNEFYGTTWGGIHHYGTVFILSGSKVTTIHAFRNTDGSEPEQITADADGNIYGATAYGGEDTRACSGGGCGTLFRVAHAKSGYVFSSIYQFNGSDGYSPRGAMEFKRSLYGTLTSNTYYGYTGGTVYKLDLEGPAKGSLTQIHQFDVPRQGLGPGGWSFGPGVHAGPDGLLYGLTSGGGINACNFGKHVIGCGVFYSISP